VNGTLFVEDFCDVLEEAMRTRLPLEQGGRSDLGFTHAETGRILAELWSLPVELAQVIEYQQGYLASPCRRFGMSEARIGLWL
jgi:HD-like signal output (HDOD) protein